MTAPGTRELDPGIALSVACGLVLIRPEEADRARLAAAIAAVPDDTPSAARGLAQVASAWLAGDMDNHALSVALAVFNAPFCASARRRATDPAHAGLVEDDMPLFAPSASTHAARVADAMED
ncbi:hypothetical protein ACIU1J_01830 [Azospirillum doebereinerae]|uniref:hypothetical protein n=1 Tax=Azospirillum doebereinerae TaxID=92933 RepID=UPI001EE55538|nr:hypothetical protein [Azospirillum doebereinerae]MCG5240071.1 hypothetical protein [Azospirillum doebereinerae]